MNQLWRLDDVTIISSLKPRGTHILITRPSDNRGQLYGKCSKISNTLKLRTPKIIVENNF